MPMKGKLLSKLRQKAKQQNSVSIRIDRLACGFIFSRENAHRRPILFLFGWGKMLIFQNSLSCKGVLPGFLVAKRRSGRDSNGFQGEI